jgi:D,D-heptose 1,7-bisphosphate phosphatase
MQDSKQLVILAGGQGTRLKSVMADRPKPLAEVAGKSLLVRQIEWAVKFKVSEIHVLIHHLGDQIRDAIGDGDRWNVPIFFHEEATPKGTAGSVLEALPKLSDRFVISYGDTLLNVDLDRMWSFHSQRQAEATLLLHPNNHPYDSDLIEISEDHWIRKFHSVPHPADVYLSNLVNAALYIVEKQPLNRWKDWPSKLDFARDLFPMMLKENGRLLGYPSREYIKDMGTPDRLSQGTKDIESGKVERLAFHHSASAIFLDRDGTLNVERNRISRHEDLQLIDGVSSAIRKINEHGTLSVLITNQPVVARGDCTFDELRTIHRKLESLLGEERAYLDAIYYCPHHPDRGFEREVADLKRLCDCRKPEIGLIRQAVEDLNIDLHQSWMVGDTTTDIATARNAGLKSVLVRTGYAGRDYRFPVRADFEFFDLEEVVNFILLQYDPLFLAARAMTADCQPGGLIAIGGLSRSGKSTWASLIRLALQARSQKAHVISMDSWLLPEVDRAPSSVRGRFDLSRFEQDWNSIVQRNTPLDLSLPVYDRNTRQLRRENSQKISIASDDVIILDGVLALDLRSVIEVVSGSFYVECDEQVHLQRFMKEYRLRGYSTEDAERLYLARSSDEHPIVKQSRAHAKQCIALQSLVSQPSVKIELGLSK